MFRYPESLIHRRLPDVVQHYRFSDSARQSQKEIARYFNPVSQFITTLSLVALKPAFPRFTRNRPSVATS